MKKISFMITRYFALITVIALVAACATGGSSRVYNGAGLAGDPVPLAQNVRRGTLPNGLRYYLLANAKPENRAYLSLAVNAGSVLEKDDEQGLAHFVEHMAFNGTARFPEMDLINYLRSLGMRFGADVNAYTTYDETVYGIESPIETDGSGVKRVPEKAIQIMDDWTHTVLFNPKDVDEERPVIQEERRMRRDAMDRMRDKMLPILFQGSPYADRRPIGLPEIVQNAPPEKLVNFYKTWYRPDNMSLIIVGDFDADALEASLPAYFTAPAPSSPLDHPVSDLQKPKKGRLDAEIFTDSELPYTIAFFYYKRQPKPIGGTLADYRESLIDYLASLMLHERFDDQTDKPETPYAGASGYNQRFGFSSRYYVMGVQAKTGLAEDAIKAVLLEKEKMERYGWTDAELERAKQETLSSLEAQNAEKDRRNSQIYVNNFTEHFLKGEITPDIEWEFETAQKLLPFISAKDVTNAVKNYFSENDLTVFVIAPESEPLPSSDQVKKLVADAKKQRIEKPSAETLDADLVTKKPSPGTLAEETVDADTGALIWRLGNGARIVLKPTANQNDEIVLYASAKGGLTSVQENEIVSARLASDMLAASGAGPYRARELSKKLAGKQVSFSSRTNIFTRGFAGVSTVKDAETLFEILYLTFTDPQFDDTAIRALLSQYETYFANRDKNPENVFSKELTRTVFGNNPYTNLMETGDLAKVDLKTVFEFVKKSLNPADYTFVFTGNINIDAFRAYITRYIASIPQYPAASAWNQWDDMRLNRPNNAKKELRLGKEDKSVVSLVWAVKEPYTEQKSATAEALTEYLGIILDNSIREKLGGVYSAWGDASLSLPLGEMTMQVYFPCDPKRVDELIKAVNAELGAIAGGTINADSFKQAKESLKKAWEKDLESNQVIAESYANSLSIYGSPLSRLNNKPALYDAVTPKDIQDMTGKLLKSPVLQYVLYPAP